jgi:predicted kinase
MKSLSLTQPHIIIMVGVPGSGKTFFADKFADTFNAPYVSLEKITPYTIDSATALRLIDHQIAELLKTRQSIIVEGGTATRTERDKLIRKARSAGYESLIVWVQTDPATAKFRSVRETKDKVNQTLSSDDYDRHARRFSAPSTLEKPTVISGKHTYATQAKIVLKKLSSPRAEIATQTATSARIEKRSHRNNIIVR